MSTSGVGYEQLNAPLKAMINAGGGGTGGSGGSFIVVPQFSTVKLTSASNTVNHNLSNFNKDFDTLLVFKNSVYIGQRDSYNIISNTQIQSSDKSNWESGTTFQFVGLCVNRAPNVLKCISIKNKVELTTSSSFIDIGVRDFDQDADTLLLFENGVYMEKGLDYRIDGSKVYPMNDTSYKGTPDCPLIFNMIVLRNVVDPDSVKDFEGSNIKDLTITMNKLSQDIQNILNNPQDKRVGNMSLLKTSSKDTLVNSINELFQYASNGKTLVANAITGKGIESNSNMTFQQLATNISNIKTGYSSGDIIPDISGLCFNQTILGDFNLNVNYYIFINSNNEDDIIGFSRNNGGSTYDCYDLKNTSRISGMTEEQFNNKINELTSNGFVKISSVYNHPATINSESTSELKMFNDKANVEIYNNWTTYDYSGKISLYNENFKFLLYNGGGHIVPSTIAVYNDKLYIFNYPIKINNVSYGKLIKYEFGFKVN